MYHGDVIQLEYCMHWHDFALKNISFIENEMMPKCWHILCIHLELRRHCIMIHLVFYFENWYSNFSKVSIEELEEGTQKCHSSVVQIWMRFCSILYFTE